MKRSALGLAAILLVAACGGGGNVGQATATPTATPSPTPSPTPQTSFVFKADLKTTEQNPPIAGPEAACNGDATITIDKTASSVKFETNVKGCPADAEVTASHIHLGAKGTNGAVKVPAFTAAELKLVSGATASTATKTVSNVDAAIVSDILANPGTYYFNVHTKANPGGVIRGQLEKKS